MSVHRLSLLLLLLSLIYVADCRRSRNRQSPPPDSYRVGVVEHAVIPPSPPDVNTRKMALDGMKWNVDAYNRTMVEAKRMGVKLLVYPEYGLYGTRMTRERMSLFAETIPDPKEGHRNPCIDRDFTGGQVQRWLSCSARYNYMFIVVNMAGREACKPEDECPSDGQFLYNTNVVFSPKGEIIARYYKTNLFKEDWFNSSKSDDLAIFDTPFGKFATFICFDIMFKKPTVELIRKHNIRNIAYSTAWVERPPIFRSIAMHSGVARAAKANILSANLHWLPTNSYGSGIYTPDGAVTYHYRKNDPKSKLLWADIHKIDMEAIEEDEQEQEDEIKDANVLDLFKTKDLPLFKFKHLTARSGLVEVCQGQFCCKATYAIEGHNQEDYAVGIYDGYILASEKKLYVQICTLLKCPNSECGTEITNVRTVFSHFSLKGTGLDSYFIFPSVMAMDEGQYKLASDAWTYNEHNGIKSQPEQTVHLHSANLLARVYRRDVLLRDPNKKKNEGSEKWVNSTINFVLRTITSFIFSIIV
uniref:Symplectin/biotinidase-like protein n=1 Tax=Pterygioteuthis hoylei TaxID=559549 RepID=A0A2Z5EQ33_PTEHO|nr:symplectin/biotinidase-like protein [Pterygioteuthis hoylei]